MLAQAHVKGIGQVGLVVGAGIEIDGQQALGRHTGRGGVELQLADRDAHAVGAEIAEAEDAAAVGHADEAHILLGPVAQYLLHLALLGDREIHAQGAPQNVVEIQAGVADCGVVDDLQEPCRIRHQRAVEQRFIAVEQAHQVDEAVEIGGFLGQLLHHAAELGFEGFGDLGHQAGEAQGFPFSGGEAGALVEGGIVQEFHPALVGVGHGWCVGEGGGERRSRTERDNASGSAAETVEPLGTAESAGATELGP